MVAFNVTNILGKFLDIIVCSNGECREWGLLKNARPVDVRKRWLINVYIGDKDEGSRVNLCPKCVKLFFCLEEKDYKAIERGEMLAGGVISPADFYAQIGARN
jgi:hypothetical protein